MIFNLADNEYFDYHCQSGFTETVGDLNAFVIDAGEGEAVLCLPSLIGCSYYFRNLIPLIEKNNYRAVVFDLPGTGLSERPEYFEYSLEGYTTWILKLLDSLQIEKFHILGHDIGAQLSLNLLNKIPERILSLSILNTSLSSESETSLPWFIQPFTWPYVRHVYMRMFTPFLFSILMNRYGIENKLHFKKIELSNYIRLLKFDNKGLEFFAMFQQLNKKNMLFGLDINKIKSTNISKQLIWGESDKILPHSKYASKALETLGIEKLSLIPGKYYLLEDNFAQVADLLFRQINENS